MSRREYVPAYALGRRIIPCGEVTLWLPGAEAEAVKLSSPEDFSPTFVAYRDVPDWQPVSPNPEETK